MTPALSSHRNRSASSVREMSGMPRWISLNCERPEHYSRMISGVHRCANTSEATATGQN
jgi:hypothetical protein